LIDASDIAPAVKIKAAADVNVIEIAALGTGKSIAISGVDGDLISLIGSGTARGINIQTVGKCFRAVSSGDDCFYLGATGGSGSGIIVSAPNGHGAYISGAAGLRLVATSSPCLWLDGGTHGLYIRTDGHGINSVGAAGYAGAFFGGGTGFHGLYLVGNGAGKDISAKEIDGIKTQTDKLTEIKADTDLIPDVKTETDKIAAVKTETDKIPAVKTETDKIAAVKTETDKIPATIVKIDAIKTTSDKFVFTGSDVRATLDGETVDLVAELKTKTAGSYNRETDSLEAIGEATTDFLTADVFLDYINREVITRDGNGNPTEYKVGTGGNQKSVNVTWEEVGGIQKCKSEEVA
jgi:hypothetical protein